MAQNLPNVEELPDKEAARDPNPAIIGSHPGRRERVGEGGVWEEEKAKGEGEAWGKGGAWGRAKGMLPGEGRGCAWKHAFRCPPVRYQLTWPSGSAPADIAFRFDTS